MKRGVKTGEVLLSPTTWPAVVDHHPQASDHTNPLQAKQCSRHRTSQNVGWWGGMDGWAGEEGALSDCKLQSAAARPSVGIADAQSSSASPIEGEAM